LGPERSWSNSRAPELRSGAFNPTLIPGNRNVILHQRAKFH